MPLGKALENEEYLKMLNEVLPTAVGFGGYCMAIVQCALELRGFIPDRPLLEAASQAQSASKAVQLAEDWIARQAPGAIDAHRS